MKKNTPYFSDEEAGKILRSKKLAGKMVFVDDMTDLFGEWVSDEIIDKHFAVFALRPDVTFQVLTKRVDRMAEYFNSNRNKEVSLALVGILNSFPHYQASQLLHNSNQGERERASNLWLGTSVENQQTANERIPHLLRCPAAVRFISAEPLLAPVDFKSIGDERWDVLHGWKPDTGPEGANTDCIDQIIVGGESGSNARPFNVEWARSIIQQCKEADVAVFCKQLGAKPGIGPYDDEGMPLCWRCGHFDFGPVDGGRPLCNRCNAPHDRLKDGHGGNPAEWPTDIRVREFPRIGKAVSK